MTNEPHFSICQLGLPGSTFQEDVALCAQLGIGLGVDERKMLDDPASAVELMAQSHVAASICCPKTLSLLPSEVMPGSEDPAERIEDICRSIYALAELKPAMIFLITGPQRNYDSSVAHSIVVEGLQAAGDAAREAGVTLGLEVMRPSYEPDWTFVTSIHKGLALLEEVDRDLKIVYDTWHLWDSPDILALTEEYAHVIGGVQLSDWRNPTRRSGDRVLPGDGKIDLKGMFEALERSGYNGWYDLEIFSDLDLEDSIWRKPALEWVADGHQKFLCLWRERKSR